ncbi:unnamed protein product [Didymodactylos carnosus]|uniref:Uncharacterized protein n=1 Tax=Didymodactylos carnosus TaxID=1234261 RepID=A0A816BMY3_9BILA|nr:unnamed protein product [Didymodactylos carnosus]CAF1623529.1 unnamed protein product [Didymodactylos carnosus]CAF4444762.1 unnamed protein product [Didymodactylos carnosus]CAF4496037.1 unnamed protein product [Didymodactylos carnosus]
MEPVSGFDDSSTIPTSPPLPFVDNPSLSQLSALLTQSVINFTETSSSCESTSTSDLTSRDADLHPFD